MNVANSRLVTFAAKGRLRPTKAKSFLVILQRYFFAPLLSHITWWVLICVPFYETQWGHNFNLMIHSGRSYSNCPLCATFMSSSIFYFALFLRMPDCAHSHNHNSGKIHRQQPALSIRIYTTLCFRTSAVRIVAAVFSLRYSTFKPMSCGSSLLLARIQRAISENGNWNDMLHEWAVGSRHTCYTYKHAPRRQLPFRRQYLMRSLARYPCHGRAYLFLLVCTNLVGVFAPCSTKAHPSTWLSFA